MSLAPARVLGEHAGTIAHPAILVVGHTYAVALNQRKLAALADAGARVGALVPETWPAREWGFVHRTAGAAEQVRMFTSPVWFRGRAGAYAYPPADLRDAIARFSPDLIEVEQEVYALSTYQVARAARRRGIPLVVFCWENVDRRLSPARMRTRGFVLDTAAAIVAGSSETAALLRRWGYGGRVEVMPQLGVDTRLFAPRAAGRRPGPVTLGFVGRLVPQKGVDLLLDAAHLLRERGRDVRVRVCGNGPHRDALHGHADRLGLGDVVTWRSAVPHDEVPDEIAALDVLVLPSRATPTWTEQFGQVLSQAMAMGVSVVGSSSGAIAEVIGRDDLVFAEDDGAALARLLDRLVTDAAYRAEVGAWGLARARERFTNEAIAARLLDVCRDVLRSVR